MTMSQYLGTGSTSRGQMSITSGLSTVVSTHPYLHTEGDKAAVIQGIVNIQNALKGVTGLKFEFPNATTTAADYVASVSLQPSNFFIAPTLFLGLKSKVTDSNARLRCPFLRRTVVPTIGWAQQSWALTMAVRAAEPQS